MNTFKDQRLRPSLKELLAALDVEVKHLQQLRHELARGCDHEEIEQCDEHYYCLTCGAHVGDIDGLWKGDPVNHKPYIKEDDPRIKAVRLPQPRRVPQANECLEARLGSYGNADNGRC